MVLSAQATTTKDTVRTDFAEYTRLVKAGRLIEAANSLSALLTLNSQLTQEQKLAINNNLGILHKKLGQYDIALKYYDAAESIFLHNNFQDNSFLVSIYGNKANIFSRKGDLNKALEYTEMAIRSIQGSNKAELVKQQSTHLLYLNLGIVYFQLNDFNLALTSFRKSLYLKDQYNLPGKDNVYLNLAKTYAKIGNDLLADKYFIQSIKESELENGNLSGNLVSIYLEYGNYLMSVNENAKGLIVVKKALNINLKIFGEKNINTSNCYQVMGGLLPDDQGLSKSINLLSKNFGFRFKGF